MAVCTRADRQCPPGFPKGTRFHSEPLAGMVRRGKNGDVHHLVSARAHDLLLKHIRPDQTPGDHEDLIQRASLFTQGYYTLSTVSAFFSHLRALFCPDRSAQHQN